MYISTNDLPNEIKSVLFSIGYRKANLEVQFYESYTLFSASGDGCRGFTLIGKNGEVKSHIGSWGGSNAFEKNKVDSDQSPIVLDEETFVIKGNTGESVYAYLVLNKNNKFGIKEVESSLLTDRQRKILYLYKGLTSAGRKEYLTSMRVTDDEIVVLIKFGMLEKKGRGIGITTEGKNNCASGIY